VGQAALEGGEGLDEVVKASGYLHAVSQQVRTKGEEGGTQKERREGGRMGRQAEHARGEREKEGTDRVCLLAHLFDQSFIHPSSPSHGYLRLHLR
jgi:hypothetical protein